MMRVRLKREGRSDDDRSLSLHVPIEIVDRAELAPGMAFVAEVTDEGILYRPIDVPPMRDPRPAWRKEEA